MADSTTTNLYKVLVDTGNTVKTAREINQLLGTQNATIVYPPSLDAPASTATIPYVMFAPYTKKPGFGGFESTSEQNQAVNSMIVDQLPAPNFTVVLPLPTTALNSQLSVEYGNADLGVRGGMIASNIKDLFSAKISNKGEAVEGMVLGALQAWGASKVAGLTGGQVTAATSLGGLTGTLMGADATLMGWLHAIEQSLSTATGGDVATGIRKYGQFQENPFTEVLFKSVPFRTHRFDYTFFPKNEAESRKIDQIIRLFKFYMLPAFKVNGVAGNGEGLGSLIKFDTPGAILSFPYEFQIMYSVQSTTFNVLPSVLESFQVNYADGVDSPRFHDNQYPAKITMSMVFREVYMMTRDRMDVTGSTNADRVINQDIAVNGRTSDVNAGRRIRF